eukprot:gene2736-28070_t
MCPRRCFAGPSLFNRCYQEGRRNQSMHFRDRRLSHPARTLPPLNHLCNNPMSSLLRLLLCSRQSRQLAMKQQPLVMIEAKEDADGAHDPAAKDDGANAYAEENAQDDAEDISPEAKGKLAALDTLREMLGEETYAAKRKDILTAERSRADRLAEAQRKLDDLSKKADEASAMQSDAAAKADKELEKAEAQQRDAESLEIAMAAAERARQSTKGAAERASGKAQEFRSNLEALQNKKALRQQQAEAHSRRTCREAAEAEKAHTAL